MFLIVSMVSSISLFIFNFWHFSSLFIIIFWIILLFISIPKYPNYLGVGRVWWVLVIFCAYPHTINIQVYFSKLSSIGVSVFMGFMVLLSLVSHRLVQLFKSPINPNLEFYYPFLHFQFIINFCLNFCVISSIIKQ